MPSASAAAPPGPPVLSVTSTRAPAAAALKAAADPAAPNPTTTTSAVSSQCVTSPASHGVTSFGSRTPSSPLRRRDGSRNRRSVPDLDAARVPPPSDVAASAATRARAGRPGLDGDPGLPVVPGREHVAPHRAGRRGALRQGRHGDRGRSPMLRAESERMVWAAPYLPVPGWSRWSSWTARPSW